MVKKPEGIFSFDQPVTVRIDKKDAAPTHDVDFAIEPRESAPAVVDMSLEQQAWHEDGMVMHDEQREHLDATREAIEKGEKVRLRSFHINDELFELGYTKDLREVSPFQDQLELSRLKAELHLDACIREIHELRESGATETQVLRRVSDQVFDGTYYDVQQNSTVLALGGQNGKERTANCEGRAKMATTILQEIGYDAEDEIFYQSFGDHVRPLVKSADGLKVIEGGVLDYEAEEGAVLTSAQDTVKAMVGIPTEIGQGFILGTKNYHSSAGHWLDDRLSKLFPGAYKTLNSRKVGRAGFGHGQRPGGSTPRIINLFGGLMERALEPFGKNAQIVGREAIHAAARVAKPAVKAAAFLGAATAANYGYHHQENSVKDLAETIEERSEQLNDLVDEASEAMEDVLKDLLDEETAEEKEEKKEEAKKLSLKGKNNQTQTKSQEDKWQGTFRAELPRGLEQYHRTHFDSSDYILRSIMKDENDTPEILNMQIDPPWELEGEASVVARLSIIDTFITPHEKETEFTQGFWKVLLREKYSLKGNRHRMLTRPDHNTDLSVINIQSPDPKHPLQAKDIIGEDGAKISEVLNDQEWRERLAIEAGTSTGDSVYGDAKLLVRLDNKPLAMVSFTTEDFDPGGNLYMGTGFAVSTNLPTDSSTIYANERLMLRSWSSSDAMQPTAAAPDDLDSVLGPGATYMAPAPTAEATPVSINGSFSQARTPINPLEYIPAAVEDAKMAAKTLVEGLQGLYEEKGP